MIIFPGPASGTLLPGIVVTGRVPFYQRDRMGIVSQSFAPRADGGCLYSLLGSSTARSFSYGVLHTSELSFHAL
jgi:hypothetical protein